MKSDNDGSMDSGESSAEDMVDTSAENDESSANDQGWLKEFVDRLTPEELVQLRSLVDAKDKQTTSNDQNNSYESFKNISGTR